MTVGLVASSASADTILCRGITAAEVRACEPVAGYANAMSQSHWGMYGGHNCTNYAAYRLSKNGVDRPSYRLGNANQWVENAKRAGVRVDSTPAPGAIGAWPGRNHIMYVDEVGPGYLLTSEDNYPGYYPKGLFQRLKVFKGSRNYPTQFIHFEDDARFGVPSGLRSTGASAGSVSLAWDEVSGAPKYRVQISESASMSGSSYHAFEGTSGTISGLDAGTRYFVRMWVVDGPVKVRLSDISVNESVSTTS